MRFEIRRDKKTDSFWVLHIYPDGTERRRLGCYQTVDNAICDLITDGYNPSDIKNRSGFPGKASDY